METVRKLSVWVPGRPAPQGSKTYFASGGGRESSKRLPAWRQAIVAAFISDRNEHRRQLEQVDAYKVDIGFYFKFPKNELISPTLPKENASLRYTGMPDVDKLSRAVLDALADARVYGNDSHVASLHAEKFRDIKPGAMIVVSCLSPLTRAIQENVEWREFS